jgi:hypothetical protein
MATELYAGEQETYVIKGEIKVFQLPTLRLSSIYLTEGVKVVERFFQVPLDYSDPAGEKIIVFARQEIPLQKAKTPEEEDKLPFCELDTSPLNSLSRSYLRVP